MKCQSQFYGKNKKNRCNLSSAEFVSGKKRLSGNASKNAGLMANCADLIRYHILQCLCSLRPVYPNTKGKYDNFLKLTML